MLNLIIYAKVPANHTKKFYRERLMQTKQSISNLAITISWIFEYFYRIFYRLFDELENVGKEQFKHNHLYKKLFDNTS